MAWGAGVPWRGEAGRVRGGGEAWRPAAGTRGRAPAPARGGAARARRWRGARAEGAAAGAGRRVRRAGGMREGPGARREPAAIPGRRDCAGDAHTHPAMGTGARAPLAHLRGLLHRVGIHVACNVYGRSSAGFAPSQGRRGSSFGGAQRPRHALAELPPGRVDHRLFIRDMAATAEVCALGPVQNGRDLSISGCRTSRYHPKGLMVVFKWH